MRVALVGAGQIARQHLACLSGLGGVELAGVCDRSPSVAECAAERHGIRAWFTDHRALLREARPEVVHVTTPPGSHFAIAMDALEAGAHVIVEKPATPTLEQLEALVKRAQEVGRSVVEDYNYPFNRAPREILARVESGELGAVVHVEVAICLDILGPAGFADPNLQHPGLELAGGAIGDFLPHLASLAHAFVGPHRRAHTVWSKRKPGVLPFDEFRGLAECESGTAALSFSASSQPDAFWLRVFGEKAQATANLFEDRLTFTRLRGGLKPLMPLFNGLEEGKAVRRAALRTLARKFTGGPGAYEGLFELLARCYRAFAAGSEPPITARRVLEVNRFVEALKPAGGRP